MSLLNSVFSGLFGAAMAPARTLNHWWGMLVASLVAALLVLLLFRLASSPVAIRRGKDRLIARVLELALFRDDIFISLGAFVSVIRAYASYIGALARPVCVSLLPMALLLVQTAAWFSVRPLRPGETALVRARLPAQGEAGIPVLSLEASGGVAVEAAVLVPSRNEQVWRVRALAPGAQYVEAVAGGRRVRKELVVGGDLAPVSRCRQRGGLWRALTNPGEPPLGKDCPLVSLGVDYPPREFGVAGVRVGWLPAYLVLTLGFAWLLKRPLRVEV